ncbi:MAG: L,D-transpeptidase [Myxococcales bacterium]|nr:MAG: L,D-transpeptidase [Myxococcales bacterium]
MGGIAFMVIAAVAFGWPQSVAAEIAVGDTAAPAPSWAKSIEVIDDGAPVMLGPSDESRRRGTVGAGTRLDFTRRVFGEGCSTRVWYETRDELFICEAHVSPSPEPPGPRVDDWAGTGSRLPQRYAFIRFDGTRAYAHPSDYFRNDYVEAFGKSFGIVVTGEQVYEGVEFIRTRRHLWVERGSVHFVQGSPFSGVKLGRSKPLDIAWVSPRPARVHERPQGRVVKRLDRHTVVHVEATKGAWTKLSGGGWIRTAELAPAKRAEPPEGVGPTDRWIDIDIEKQVLVAYEGSTPMFATLVSTGRNTKQSKTPLGVFQIWVKLDYTDMDDIERTDIPKNYSIQDVPWVQFFKGSYGFHAAFWHNDFGRRRSHGCINLSPKDARYLFHFTQPILPPGWNAILPLPEDHPTTVQIR